MRRAAAWSVKGVERETQAIAEEAARRAGMSLGDLARVNHPYPTQSQAIKLAADAYLATVRRPARNRPFKQWPSR